jgi:hypothetical protein
MNRKLLLVLGCCALALGACESRADYRAKKAQREALKVVSKLDCPETQGGLKRASAAADGLSCVYSGDDAEVTLRLIKISGDPNAALAPIDAELKALMPPEPPEAPEAPEAAAAPAAPAPPTPPAPGEEPSAGKQTVRLPGLTVETDEAGETANIRMPGMKINADENNAHVEIGGTVIDASDDRNEVKVTSTRWSADEDEDSGMKIDTKDGDVSVHSGFSGFRIGGGNRSGFRSTFVKTTDKETSVYTAVGYEARGPKNGPMVVAVVKSKSPKKAGKTDNIFRNAAALVKLNVGG